MTSIICEADFLSPNNTIIAVSASFQAALTPWLSTLAANKYGAFSPVNRIQCYSLSPTFRYTSALSVFFKSNEEQQRLMNSDLCAPLFSHLKTLAILFKGERSPLNDGNAVADFILKFQRLENFRLILRSKFACNIHGSELITFYLRMFHSQNISQTLLISIVKSYAENITKWCRTSREKSSECDSLIKQHQIIPFFVQKMVEVYRNDHGETLIVFLTAIISCFERIALRTEDGDDSVEELVPMFDLIGAIVSNNDLLHSCFQPHPEEVLFDPELRKWSLPGTISSLLSRFLPSTNYCRLDFMQRYGRTLLPQLTDFTFLKYDESEASFAALVKSLSLFFDTIDDFLWTDEVESSTDEEGLRRVLGGGRRLLQHIPFDKLKFVFAQQVRLGKPLHFMKIHFAVHFFDSFLQYCNSLASLRSSEVKSAVARDIAPSLVRHNLLPLSFDLIVFSFDHFVQQDNIEGLSNCLSGINILLGTFRTNQFNSYHLLPLAAIFKRDFFMNRNVLEKMLELAQKVCDTSDDAFSIFRHVIDERRKNASTWSEKDLKNAKAHKETAEKLIKRFVPYLHILMKAAKTTLRENKNEWDGNDNEEGISTDDSHQKIMDYVARIDDFVNIGLRGLIVEYRSFVSENQKTMTLLEQP